MHEKKRRISSSKVNRRKEAPNRKWMLLKQPELVSNSTTSQNSIGYRAQPKLGTEM